MIRYIYTFFVGLFLAIFVGMGIQVFYDSPKPPEAPDWYNSTSMGKFEPSEAERKQESEYNAKMKVFNETTMSNYNRNVSIIVLSCAVVVLAISLIFDAKLGVIADGLLLGGIFTLLYGIGRGIAVDSNKFRFLVASIGLLITIVLGFLKFAPIKLKVSK
jgi:hypothetical protein